jgi:hypothetical protein
VKTINALILISVLIFISGCAEIDMPTPEDVLRRPLGTDSVKRGMSKDQVKDLWGEPDETTYEEIEETGTVRSREVWIYKGRYAALPVDAGYLSKTKYLYFDGNSLTMISDVELKKTEEKE